MNKKIILILSFSLFLIANIEKTEATSIQINPYVQNEKGYFLSPLFKDYLAKKIPENAPASVVAALGGELQDHATRVELMKIVGYSLKPTAGQPIIADNYQHKLLLLLMNATFTQFSQNNTQIEAALNKVGDLLFSLFDLRPEFRQLINSNDNANWGKKEFIDDRVNFLKNMALDVIRAFQPNAAPLIKKMSEHLDMKFKELGAKPEYSNLQKQLNSTNVAAVSPEAVKATASIADNSETFKKALKEAGFGAFKGTPDEILPLKDKISELSVNLFTKPWVSEGSKYYDHNFGEQTVMYEYVKAQSTNQDDAAAAKECIGQFLAMTPPEGGDHAVKDHLQEEIPFYAASMLTRTEKMGTQSKKSHICALALGYMPD